jgi:hypothetical protein
LGFNHEVFFKQQNLVRLDLNPNRAGMGMGIVRMHTNARRYYLEQVAARARLYVV